MKRLLLIVAALLTIGGTMQLAYAPQTASADAKDEICGGIGAASGKGGCKAEGTSIEGIIKAIINVLSLAAGIGGVIMVLVAGFRYMTSGGDSSKVSGAKSALIYAVVGLVIAAFAQFIVQFVLKKAGV